MFQISFIILSSKTKNRAREIQYQVTTPKMKLKDTILRWYKRLKTMELSLTSPSIIENLKQVQTSLTNFASTSQHPADQQQTKRVMIFHQTNQKNYSSLLKCNQSSSKGNKKKLKNSRQILEVVSIRTLDIALFLRTTIEKSLKITCFRRIDL